MKDGQTKVSIFVEAETETRDTVGSSADLTSPLPLQLATLGGYIPHLGSLTDYFFSHFVPAERLARRNLLD